ncbi:T9SS type A sorting domain-containing protein [Persicobacter psychrovividus]|uniref:IPT/TIG domain-containing protein n=1 Tax=Persicobacter psychrovividus TaxID=387638 RepID=A0ABN6LC67_9BACT|nr:hypothetical protein PEPS_30750 [Persicobacter psychrovividus]
MKKFFLRTKVLFVALILCFFGGLNLQAQTIGEFNAGAFPSDTLSLAGEDLSKVTAITINSLDCSIVPGGTDEMIYFVVPADASTGPIVFVGETTFTAEQPFSVLGRISDAEQMIFFEPMENSPFGGGQVGQVASAYPFDNQAPISFTGTATGNWGWQGGGHPSYSGRMAMSITGGQELVISGINTTGYENIRFAYAIAGANGWDVVDGRLKIAYSANGSDFVNINPSTPWGAGGWYSFIRTSAQLPATENLTIKIYAEGDMTGTVNIDDVQITGYPEGSANIAGFAPAQQVVGKQVVIQGSALTDVTNVEFGKLSTTDFEMSANGKTLTFTLPKGAEHEGDSVKVKNDNDEWEWAGYMTGEANVKVIRSKGGNVSSVDKLKALPAVPTIEALSPTQAPVGGAVYITGMNLHKTTKVMLGDVEITEFMEHTYKIGEEGNMRDTTFLEFYVPEGAAQGMVKVATDNNDDVAESSDQLEIDMEFPAVSITVSAEEGNEQEETEIDVILEATENAIDETSFTIVVSGEGINDDDYDLSADELTIAKGEKMSDTAVLKILNDGDDLEEEEVLIMTLGMRIGSGAVITKDGRQASVTITLPLSIGTEEVLADDLAVIAKDGQVTLFTKDGRVLNNAQVGLYDASGRLKSVHTVNGSEVSLPANAQVGVYFLRVVEANKVSVKRFLMQ